MATKRYQITGRVIGRTSRKGIAGLRIEVWDKDLIYDDFVGSAVTDAQGRFRMAFDVSYFQEIFEDRRPDLYFKVFYRDRLIHSTEESVLWNVEKGESEVTIEIEMESPTEADENVRLVKGTVALSDGVPGRSLTVRAMDKSLRKEQPLGEAVSDKEGKYEITCYPADPTRTFLIVRAYSAAGDEVGASEIVYGIEEEMTVDFVVDTSRYRGPSEFERIGMDLKDDLLSERGEPISVTSLTRDEITFLAGKHNISPDHLSLYVQSARLSESLADSDIGDQTVFPEVFFGLGLHGIPLELDQLLDTDPGEIQRAVQGALDNNQISSRLNEFRTAIQDAIQRVAVAHALKEPAAGGAASLGTLLQSSSVNAERHKDFAALYFEHDGDIEAFWNKVEKSTDFTAIEKADLRFTVGLGALTRYHMPLVKELQKRKQNNEITSMKDLAKWDEARWESVLKSDNGEGAIGVPSGTPGDTPAQQRKNYANSLVSLIEISYPTAVIAREVTNDTTYAHRASFQTFLNNNPSFELGTMAIDDYLAENAAANHLEGISNQEEFQKELKTFQRQFMLSPAVGHYRSIKALRDMGVESSWDIYEMDWEEFSDDYAANDGNAEDAASVYENAQTSVASATVVTARYDDTDYAEPAATRIPGYQKAIREHATLSKLFGAQDYCKCRHCRSVYSPSSYFTDLLHYLKKIPHNYAGKLTDATKTQVLDVLLSRRPDLCHIDLTCENALTTLPYIDLVNELLESHLILVYSRLNPSQLFESIKWEDYQTTLTAKELLANPEHLNTTAYAILKEETYPWILPFDLWTEEVRVYLSHLGVKRRDLLDRFGKTASFNYLSADANIDEWLNMIAGDRTVMLDSNPSKPWLYWGLNETGNTYPNPKDSTKTDSLAWRDALARVTIFMERSGMSYEDVKLLLKCFPWDSSGNLQIVYSADAPCDLNRATIKGLSTAILNKMHRFVRLSKKTGWTFAELAMAIKAMGASDVTKSLLQQFAHLLRIQAILKISLEELLSWYADINTRAGEQPEDKSLYEELFLNRTVKNPVADLFLLNTAGTDLKIAETSNTQLLDDEKLYPYYIAALRTSEEDLKLMLKRLELTKQDSDGFAVANPGSSLVQYHLHLANLSLLHRHVSLARALNLTITDLFVMKVLTGKDPFKKTLTGDTIRFICDAGTVSRSGFQVDELDYLFRHESKASLAIVPPEKTVTLRVKEITDGLKQIQLKHQDETAAELKQREQGFVKERMASNLNLDQKIAGQLLESWLTAVSDAGKLLVEDFLGADESKKAQAYLLLYKISVIASRLKVDPSEIQFLFKGMLDLDHKGTGNNTWNPWIDLQKLPVKKPVNAADAQELFAKWKQIVDLFQFRDRMPEGKLKLFDLLFDINEGPVNVTLTQLPGRIEDFTEWDEVDIGSLQTGFNLQAVDFLQPDTWLRIETCIKMSKRVGVSTNKLLSWAGPPTKTTADAVKHAAKSRYDLSKWSTVARPLRDELRKKQRDALVAWLVAWQSGINSVDDLFGYYLIDTQVQPCMLTSRIKLAISSVQTFVQRCLMNLEAPLVVIKAAQQKKWARWNWMKNYRVWEANRKVFLYPENWIEPQLRDDKSPFFKELESEILQNDVTKENVEKALRNYLAKLNEVANLEIWAMCRGTDPQEKDVIHVFGRTRSNTPVYYYRKWVEKPNTWTAWEKIDVGIEGDHLIPAFYSNRLYLFWPVFKEKVVQPTEMKKPDDKISAQKPKKTWEIYLARSEYLNGQWTDKIENDDDHIPIPSAFTKYDDPDQLDLSEFKFYVDENQTKDMLRMVCIQFRSKEILKSPKKQIISYNQFTAGEFEFRCNGKIEASDLKLDEFSIKENPSFVRRYQYLKGLYPLKLGGKEIIQRKYDDWARIVFVPAKHLVDSSGDVTEVMDTRFFLQDSQRAFLVEKQKDNTYLFESYYHPFISDFVKSLNKHGLKGLFDPPRNTKTGKEDPLSRQLITRTFFYKTYQPGSMVKDDQNYPVEEVDFSYEGPYSMYNWELFYHIPMLIADKLNKNKKFADAQKWYHFIFDPTDASEYESPKRYWQIKPFFEKYDKDKKDSLPKPIHELMQILSHGNIKEKKQLEKQVEDWRDNPFMPHVIARLRDTAYQKSVVMKYIDNLLDWGDDLFRQDTIETINEATQLYILASQILGPKPRELPEYQPKAKSFKELGKLDAFSNAVAAWEDVFVPYKKYVLDTSSPHKYQGLITPYVSPSQAKHSSSEVEFDIVLFRGFEAITPQNGSEQKPRLIYRRLYFCIPHNDILLNYWDRVADRLFKIRHCLNIEGVFRILPLYQPPIDPGLLVKAAAAGVNIQDALKGISIVLPHYRFQFTLAKALELCNDVRNLGNALLAALEKRDAEKLALMRAGQEVKLLDAVKAVRKDQIKEAKQAIEALKQSRKLADTRYSHYKNLDFMNPWEIAQLAMMGRSLGSQMTAWGMNLAASIVTWIPDTTLGISGWAGTPVTTLTVGGSKASDSLSKLAGSFSSLVGFLQSSAQMSGTQASYRRREEEWELQEKLALIERQQTDKQLLAAQIRQRIAEKELKNHEQQIKDSKTNEAFLKSKFTDQDLYDWMVSQLSAVYFQSYQMAQELARKAEKCFDHEIGLNKGETFIQNSHWDSLKKGLLAGDKLQYDLKRMEVAYLDRNKREYELTKHVSLAMLDPIALLRLKQDGTCYVNLPEVLFDLDYPGHYRRRIKSLSLTIPCVTGPYTNVSCTLRLTKSQIRINNSLKSGKYPRDASGTDDRFKDNVGVLEAIATSSGQNDSGLFELSFRDDRYLPFEGAGAISTWQLELPSKFMQFDYDTISDVILHINYTARDGGSALKTAAETNLQTSVTKMIELGKDSALFRFFSAKHEFPTEWHRFLHTPDATKGEQTLDLDLRAERFPFFVTGKKITIDKVHVFVKVALGTDVSSMSVVYDLKKGTSSLMGTGQKPKLVSTGGPGGMAMKGTLYDATLPQTAQSLGSQPWKLVVPKGVGGGVRKSDGWLNPKVVEDVWLVCQYSIS